jgi:uncharacterized membrane protein
MSFAKQSRETFGSERVIAFSDAVMAVAITLLVLDLKLPEGIRDDELYAAIPSLSHALWCYLLSFVVIGVLWMVHHNQFHSIRRVDAVLLWLNLFFLMSVALIPFVTSVLSDHATPLPTMVYAAVLMANCTMTAAMWWYASRTPGLMSPDVPADQRRGGADHAADRCRRVRCVNGCRLLGGILSRPMDMAARGRSRPRRRPVVPPLMHASP